MSNGIDQCTVECEHCDVTTDSCAWCVFDENGDGNIGLADFGLFASCFGQCVSPGDPCNEVNWDGSPDGCIGTGDFAGFAGCFSLPCAACPTCSGSAP